jgi:hypothetical protein
MRATKDKINAMIMIASQNDFSPPIYSVTDFGKARIEREIIDGGRARKDEPLEEQIRQTLDYYSSHCHEIISHEIVDHKWYKEIRLTVLSLSYSWVEFKSRWEAEKYIKENFDHLYKFWLNPATIEPDF